MIHLQRAAILTVIATAHITLSMEQNTVNNHQVTALTVIKQWQDLQPFAAQVIAYTTSHQVYMDHGFHIESNPTMRYGFVEVEPTNWECGSRGYEIWEVFKPNAVTGVFGITNGYLAESTFQVRYATPQEIKIIHDAAINGKVILGHHLMLPALKHALSKCFLEHVPDGKS